MSDEEANISPEEVTEEGKGPEEDAAEVGAADATAQALDDADALKEKIRALLEEKNDGTLADISLDPIQDLILRKRRTLRGHLGKVYGIAWSSDGKQLVTSSQDSKILVWDSQSTNKISIIPVSSQWMMGISFSPSGRYVACGGLDNLLSVFDLETKDFPPRPSRCLSEHEAFISTVKFVDENKILTSSGDETVLLWDIETGVVVTKFEGHEKDVMGLDVVPDRSAFVTGGNDQMVKFWDVNSGKCEKTFFTSHKGDINSVSLFPNGNAVATGSDDGTCELLSIQAWQKLATLDSGSKAAISSVDFSASGRMLFAGCDDAKVRAWDIAGGGTLGEVCSMGGKVSSLAVHPQGFALGTAGWDQVIHIWA